MLSTAPLAPPQEVYWDEEHQVSTKYIDADGNEAVRKVAKHFSRSAKRTFLDDVVVVSNLERQLRAGDWRFPFTYKLREDLPGCIKYVWPPP